MPLHLNIGTGRKSVSDFVDDFIKLLITDYYLDAQ